MIRTHFDGVNGVVVHTVCMVYTLLLGAVEELSEEELGEDDNEIEHTIEKTIIMHSSCASDCQDGFEVHEGDDTQICYGNDSICTMYMYMYNTYQCMEPPNTFVYT